MPYQKFLPQDHSYQKKKLFNEEVEEHVSLTDYEAYEQVNDIEILFGDIGKGQRVKSRLWPKESFFWKF